VIGAGERGGDGVGDGELVAGHGRDVAQLAGEPDGVVSEIEHGQGRIDHGHQASVGSHLRPAMPAPTEHPAGRLRLRERLVSLES
jgi:hypothetical protein